MKFIENAYLRYTPEITEDMYNGIIQGLKDQGFRYHNHWSQTENGSYEEYSRHKALLMIDTIDSCYHRGKIFTLDNNNQTIRKQIFLDDVLCLIKIDKEYQIF